MIGSDTASPYAIQRRRNSTLTAAGCQCRGGWGNRALPAILALVAFCAASTAILFAKVDRLTNCSLAADYDDFMYETRAFLGMFAPGGHASNASMSNSWPNFGFYVISLQGVDGSDSANSDRLDAFLSQWEAKCKNSAIKFEVCPAVLHPKRGFGLVQSFVNCFDKAIEDNVTAGFFFEDDAELVQSSFCFPEYQSDIIRGLPDNAYSLLLGGHRWRFLKYRETRYVRVGAASGSFGFAVPQANLRHLRDSFDRDTRSKNIHLSPDRDWFQHARETGKQIYAANPQIVRHVPGYSNTWNRTRLEKLEEVRCW